MTDNGKGKEETLREAMTTLADEWEESARLIGERALLGDPGSALATASTLRSCAAELRAALTGSVR
jgi:hypothetical protein